MIKKIGVIITSYSYNYIFVKQTIECYLKYFKNFNNTNFLITLYVNQTEDEKLLNIYKEYAQINVVYMNHDNGGITRTWNKGIKRCMENNCEIIILNNDNILFDDSIHHIIEECDKCKENELYYYGPLTNDPGTSPNNTTQHSKCYRDEDCFIMDNSNSDYINGFFMVFPKHVLNANKFDETNYFDPQFPYKHNEIEWFERFIKKGGLPKIVPRTFIYHYQNNPWNNKDVKSKCVYTINLGNYEGNMVYNTNMYDKHDQWDFLYFTDNHKLIYECLKVNVLPFIITSNKDVKLLHRIIKTSPHLYLPFHYDLSIYLDGNLKINDDISNINSFVSKYNLNKYDLICFEHPGKDHNVEKEIEFVINEKLETEKHISLIKKEFTKNNYELINSQISETNILIRRHKKIINFSNDWTRHVTVCKRDQISFDYLLWKHKLKFNRDKSEVKEKIITIYKHINSCNRKTIESGIYKSTLGFIITRHVNSRDSNEYWIECIKNIRKNYPENMIMIIDDNSNYEFIDTSKINDILYNCFIIKNEYIGRGELMPFYYFYHYKLFDKAVIIHDSVFMLKKLEFEENDIQFLWTTNPDNTEKERERELIRYLNNNEKLLKLYNNEKLWNRCFGSMCFINRDFLKKIVDKYNFFILLNHIKTKDDRYVLETVFSIICHSENEELINKKSLLGDINEYSKYRENYIVFDMEEYKIDLEDDGLINYPLVKIWTGR